MKLISTILVFLPPASALSAQEFPPANGTLLKLDGVDDQLLVGSSPSPYEHTVEAWIFPTSTGPDSQLIAGHASFISSTGCSTGYSLKWRPKGISYQLDIDSCGTTSGGSLRFDTEPYRWYHVAGTFDGSEMRLYVNGELKGTASGVRFDPIDWISLGSWTSSQYPTQNRFSGALDEVRIWNTARTQSDIQRDLSKSLVGNEPNLLALWPFDDATGQVATDLAGGNDATLGNTGGIDISDPTWVAPLPVLTQPTFVAGQTATLTLKRGVPGTVAGFGFSLAGTDMSLLHVQGCSIQIYLEGPYYRAGTSTFDSSGIASLLVSIPAAAAGLTIWVQAVELPRCEVSNFAEIVVQ